MTIITEQLGRVLADRYRLDAGLGTGASAHVYAAFDVRLGRKVALKLLHPGLTGDHGFQRRFRSEAAAVAALSHPHVLKLYDWGEEPEGTFLVLELLEGGSLRDLLDTGARLDPAQAARIGAQAARGLAYAHRRGFVHRDVKPGNLLFDEDGDLRVGDFGLARALAEAAWTEPAGAVLGSARYASPELAGGRLLDDRSDVYSLALVLYEAVVGRVPFSADTTLATLMARVGAPLPVAPELGPLAPILAQAAIAEPVGRLDASELAQHLELLSRRLSAPRPLPLAPRSSTGEHATGLAPRQSVTRDGPRVQETGWQDVVGTDTGWPGTVEAERLDGSAVRGAQVSPARPRRSRSRRRFRRRMLAALLGVLVLLAAGGAAYVRYVVYRHVVPDVVGMSVSSAGVDATRAGLRLELRSSRYSSSFAAGVVITESLRPGTHARSGTALAVVASLGRAPVPVPSVTGKARPVALHLLAAGHLVARMTTAYSESIAAGTVISADPSSGTAAYGSPVAIVVSKGPAPRTIPSGLDGAAWASVRSSLDALRLEPVEQFSYSTSVPAGDVLSTDPGGGSAGIAVGSAVTVVVSKGPLLVPVPSVQGQSIAAALATLRDAGLDVTEQIGPPDATYATTTVPAPGNAVAPGTQVTLYAG